MRGWADPPPQDTSDTTGYSQQAGGTHPTGMHSCLSIVSVCIITAHAAKPF